MSRPLVFAHRGASAKCFENTLAAFQKAADVQADGIELDVQLTSDGVPVVLHDPTLQRVAGKPIEVSRLTWEELTLIRVGKRFGRRLFGSKIPSLQEAVSFCLLHHLALNIELKEGVAERPDSLPAILHLANLLDEVHISSFDYCLLEQVKELDQAMETALLLKKKQLESVREGVFTAADSLHFHKRLWKDGARDILISSGKPLRMYGVNGKEGFIPDAKSFVSGWITDYPERFLE